MYDKAIVGISEDLDDLESLSEMEKSVTETSLRKFSIDDILIFTGGCLPPNNVPEAKFMEQYARVLGFARDIRVEEKSKDTFAQVWNTSMKYLVPLDIEKALWICTDYHVGEVAALVQLVLGDKVQSSILWTPHPKQLSLKDSSKTYEILMQNRADKIAKYWPNWSKLEPGNFEQIYEFLTQQHGMYNKDETKGLIEPVAHVERLHPF